MAWADAVPRLPARQPHLVGDVARAGPAEPVVVGVGDPQEALAPVGFPFHRGIPHPEQQNPPARQHHRQGDLAGVGPVVGKHLQGPPAAAAVAGAAQQHVDVALVTAVVHPPAAEGQHRAALTHRQPRCAVAAVATLPRLERQADQPLVRSPGPTQSRLLPRQQTHEAAAGQADQQLAASQRNLPGEARLGWPGASGWLAAAWLCVPQMRCLPPPR